MDAALWSERLMGMDDATWRRHANPWSGWTRVSLLPLFAAALWSRVWIGPWALVPVAAVLVWSWLNPRVFPPPRSADDWMTRGVLGERLWLARADVPVPRPHRQMAVALLALSTFGTLAMLAGLVLLDPTVTLAGMITAALAKLWFLDRMVWLREEVLARERGSGGRGRIA